MKSLLFLILLSTVCRAEPHLPPGTKALQSAAEKGRGPLALVNLNHHVLGLARVFGGKEPDLFVAGYGGPQAVHLFKRVDTAESGAPVFAEPVVVKSAFKDKGCVFQRADGRVVGLWIDKEELAFCDENVLVIQPASVHETGTVGTMLSKDGPNLPICDEAGRMFLIPEKAIKTVL